MDKNKKIEMGYGYKNWSEIPDYVHAIDEAADDEAMSLSEDVINVESEVTGNDLLMNFAYWVFLLTVLGLVLSVVLG